MGEIIDFKTAIKNREIKPNPSIIKGKVADFKPSIENCEIRIDECLDTINQIIEYNYTLGLFLNELNCICCTIYNVFDLYFKIEEFFQGCDEENANDISDISIEVYKIIILLKKRMLLKASYDEVFGYIDISQKPEEYVFMFRGNLLNKYDSVAVKYSDLLYDENCDFPFKSLVYKETIFMKIKNITDRIFKREDQSDFDERKWMVLSRMRKNGRF